MIILKVLFFLLFLLLPLGQIERIPLANPQIGFYIHDIIIFLIVFLWLGMKIVQKQKIKVGKIGKPILLFLLIAFTSFAVNSFGKNINEITIAFLYLSRWAVYAGLYFVIVNEKNIRLFGFSIIQLLVFVGFAFAVFGLIQYFAFPDIRSLAVYQWDPHFYRVVGTLLEPGFLGLIFVLAMILIIASIIFSKINLLCVFRSVKSTAKKGDKKELIIDWLILIILYIPFALTYSRSAYFAFITAICAIAYFRKNLKFLLITLCIFVLTILVLPRPGGEGVKLERQASIYSRLISWNQGFDVFKKHPFLGIGFNYYRYKARDLNYLSKQWQVNHAGAGVDNSFIFILATTGIVGFVFYLNLLYKITANALLKNQKTKIIVIASLSAIVVHAFLNNSLFYPWVMIWFWMLCAATEYS